MGDKISWMSGKSPRQTALMEKCDYRVTHKNSGKQKLCIQNWLGECILSSTDPSRQSSSWTRCISSRYPHSVSALDGHMPRSHWGEIPSLLSNIGSSVLRPLVGSSPAAELISQPPVCSAVNPWAGEFQAKSRVVRNGTSPRHSVPLCRSTCLETINSTFSGVSISVHLQGVTQLSLRSHPTS